MTTIAAEFRPFTHRTLELSERVFHVFRGETQIGSLHSMDSGKTWRATRICKSHPVAERSRLGIDEAKAFVVQ